MSKEYPSSSAAGTSGRRLLSTPAILLILTAALLALCAYMWWGPTRPPQKPTDDAEVPAKALVEEAAELLWAAGDSPPEQARFIRLRDRMQTYVSGHRNDVLVLPLLAQVYWRLGQNDKAEQTVNDAIKRIGPSGTLPARLLCLKGMLVRQRGGKDKPPLFYFEDALNRPGADAETWAEYALEALAAGDEKQKAQAQRYLDRVLAEGKFRAEQWAGYGLRLALLDHPKAPECLDKGLRGTRQPRILAPCGLILLQRTNQQVWGRQYLSEARKAMPASPEFLRAWGEAELRINNRQRGRELLTESLRLRADQPECYDLLARSTAGAEGPAQAEQFLMEGMAACPKPQDRGWLCLRLAEVREQQQKYRDAAESYEAAAPEPAQRFVAAKGAARCYLRIGRYSDAAKWIDEAAKLNAQDAEVHQLKAQLEQVRPSVR